MSLNVSNLTVHHGAICAVNQVSLAVPTGKLAAIIGSNGAGKTTNLLHIQSQSYCPKYHYKQAFLNNLVQSQ